MAGIHMLTPFLFVLYYEQIFCDFIYFLVLFSNMQKK